MILDYMLILFIAIIVYPFYIVGNLIVHLGEWLWSFITYWVDIFRQGEKYE